LSPARSWECVIEVEVVKPHFEVNMEARMVDIINMKVNLMEVDEETLEEEEVGNLGTWQRIVIKRNMMHEMESCNKGIMHQLVIKVMNNCL
jgi:hypothetical protein